MWVATWTRRSFGPGSGLGDGSARCDRDLVFPCCKLYKFIDAIGFLGVATIKVAQRRIRITRDKIGLVKANELSDAMDEHALEYI